MCFAHHEVGADLCATDVKEIAYTSTIEIVLSHNENRCISFQYSYMIIEEEPSLYDQTMTGRQKLF